MALAPLSPDDTAAALAVWNGGALRQLSRELFDEKVWRDDDVGNATSPMRIAARDASGQMLGFGVAVPRSVRPRTGAIKLLAVAPTHHRQGVGSAIVGRLVEALRGAGCTTVHLGESPPNYFQPGIDESNTGARAFVEHLGWTQTGRVYDMTCTLDREFDPTVDDLERLTRAGLVVRRALDEDQRPLRALLEKHWAAWKPELQAASQVEPCAVFVAVTADKEVVGFAAHSANNASLGWFGPMGTDPAYRGLGIGRVLLRLCLADLRRAGFPACTIPWVGPVSFYEQAVGARVARTLTRYRRALT